MQDYLYNLATDKSGGFIAGVVRVFLFMLSLIYGLVVRILILFYRIKPYRLDCRVISVGNITLGGTGKTSLVEYIARYLKSQGHKVAIISRGYKRKIPNPKSQIPNYERIGDEPYMLTQKLGDIPVIVDPNRIRAAKKAIRDYSADTVILDDGFQQWRIKKDLEIVTVDAVNPLGNSKMLPRGILREPISSLRRSDIFVLTKVNLSPDTQEIKDFLKRINSSAIIFESMHLPLGFYRLNKQDELLNTQACRGKTVTLFSGIADPGSFENLIKNLGIKIGLSFKFRDHHHYNKEDLDKIIHSSQAKNIDTIITTEKDVARLDKLQVANYPLQILVLRIGLVITKDEQRFYNRLLELYSL